MQVLVLKKVGFIEEGLLRQVEYKNGQWNDSYLYAILKDDWIHKRDKIVDNC